MDIKLLNVFLEEILGNLHDKEIINDLILKLVKHLDAQEQYWHVEGKRLWRIKAWRLAHEKHERLREQSRQYNEVVNKRKEAMLTLIKNVAESLKLDPNHQVVMLVVQKIITSRSNDLAKQYGVDLTTIPDLPKGLPHIVLDDNGKEKYRL